jgi:dTDP-4-dehydrorhamnose reductase
MLRVGRERNVLTIVDDQVGAPTTSAAIADATRAVVDCVLADGSSEASSWSGTYHMTCGGSTSWFGFAKEIFARAAGQLDIPSPELRPIPSSSYPTPARRPANSVLSNQKLQDRFGVQLPQWTDALDDVIHQLASSDSLKFG